MPSEQFKKDPPAETMDIEDSMSLSDEVEENPISYADDDDDESGIIQPKKDLDDDDTTAENDGSDADELNNFWQRQAKRVARSPCWFLWVSLILGIVLSVIAIIVGEFEVSAETGGWQSRGTVISDRQNQLMMANFYRAELLYGGDEVWNDLINNIQPGWDSNGDDDDGDDERRRLRTLSTAREELQSFGSSSSIIIDLLRPESDRIALSRSVSLSASSYHKEERRLPFELTNTMRRSLQEQFDEGNTLEGCDMGWYSPGNLTSTARLWPLWKNTDETSGTSSLDPEIIHDICVAEQNTLKFLEEKNLCFGCSDGKCLPPYSVVFYARLRVPDGMTLSCAELRDAWKPHQESTEAEWKTCVEDIRETYDPNVGELPDSCPVGFIPSFIDVTFDETQKTVYTSSIFPTEWEDVDELYNEVDNFDRGSDLVAGAYDTQWESFVGITVDDSLTSDMALALGSAVVVAFAIIIHTRSPLITIIGLTQIILSFPLSYFVYKLLAGLEFFPFLNFIGIFVVFALGAGDIFVAIDKWKNARMEHPNASTEYVAAVALPDAAAAMFLTTLTTAVAFFATAICPVAPIKMFAIFCGLLIIFDYLMNVLLVFPALCIYDRALMAKGPKGVNCCITCSCFGLLDRKKSDEDDDEEEEEGADGNNDDVATSNKDSNEEEYELNLIRRILLGFYRGLHYVRWPLFMLCIVAFILSAYFASTLEMPTSSDVRLLNEEMQFEQNYLWRQNLLSEVLDKAGGSQAYVIWGVEPADTGDKNNPASWTQLVIDDSFDASSEEAQVYLSDSCDDLFGQEFATRVESDYVCPIQQFGIWLQEQSNLQNVTERDPSYEEHCNAETGLPVSPDIFDPCILAWANQVGETSILPYKNHVQVILLPFISKVRYDDHFDLLDDEWNLIEDWMTKQMDEVAPAGVNRGYFSSDDFWWYDTNGQMLQTAYSAAAIAICCAAAVILLSSHSFLLTLFSTLTIAYVLTSVTAMLVAFGWTLGFLEAICFAILIGVSVDFVIHFSHAYSLLKGNASRERRTRYALITMGPSILATALTTILSAMVMLFTVISFFQKFALILFLTVVQATLGSFVLFLTLVDCIGPANPTYVVDRFVLRKGKGEEEGDVGETGRTQFLTAEFSDRSVTQRSGVVDESASNSNNDAWCGYRIVKKVERWMEEGKAKTPLMVGVAVLLAFNIAIVIIAISR